MPDKCIGCGYCFRHCPNDVHRMDGGRHVLHRSACRGCGLCAQECYAGALEIIGRDITVATALQEALRDRPFYEASGGGITLSGGEPMMQIDFTAALLRAAKEQGLHTCVETSGYCESERFERIMADTDLFLYDIKETDRERHRQYTGVPLDPILENLRTLHEAGATIILRLPIVPGVNDRDGHFEAVAALARRLPRLNGVELLPYHRLGTAKLARLGLPTEGRVDCDAPDRSVVKAWVSKLRELGVTALNAG